jgi:hypothetical protein
MNVLSTFMDVRRRIHGEEAMVFDGIGCGVACTVSHGDSQKTLAESLFTSHSLSCAQEEEAKIEACIKWAYGPAIRWTDGHSRFVRMKSYGAHLSEERTCPIVYWKKIIDCAWSEGGGWLLPVHEGKKCGTRRRNP